MSFPSPYPSASGPTASKPYFAIADHSFGQVVSIAALANLVTLKIVPDVYDLMVNVSCIGGFTVGVAWSFQFLREASPVIEWQQDWVNPGTFTPHPPFQIAYAFETRGTLRVRAQTAAGVGDTWVATIWAGRRGVTT